MRTVARRAPSVDETLEELLQYADRLRPMVADTGLLLNQALDRGETVPGTHKSSPANLNMRKKALWTTGIAFAIWLPIAVVLVFGLVTVDDVDVWHRLRRTGG